MALDVDSRQAVSVARQPILDRNGHIFGHELLYRHTPDANSCTQEVDLAGARTLTDAVLSIGLEPLTSGLPAFINLTRQLLLEGAATLLPPQIAVLEIREDVPVDEEVIAACQKLHADGYALALDDFESGSVAEALLPWCKYVKIDVLQTPPTEWRALVSRLAAQKLQMVAEKVETAEVAERARACGFHLFQGYYFCRPTTFATTPLPARRLAYLELLNALNRPNLSLSDVEDLVKHDLSLSYRVLRSINSAAFGVHREVTSIRGALVLLGVAQIRKWASVWAIAGLSGGESPAAVSVALVRARCCEQLADVVPGADAGGYFLLGLCSLLDVILRRPMSQALNDMPLQPAIRDALLGSPNSARAALETIIAYEQGEWAVAAAGIEKLGCKPEILPAIYAEALRWSRQLAQFSAA